MGNSAIAEGAMTDVRDALFLSFIPPFSMNKMHPKGTCGCGHLGFIILAKIQKGGHDGLDDTRFG